MYGCAVPSGTAEMEYTESLIERCERRMHERSSTAAAIKRKTAPTIPPTTGPTGTWWVGREGEDGDEGELKGEEEKVESDGDDTCRGEDADENADEDGDDVDEERDDDTDEDGDEDDGKEEPE